MVWIGLILFDRDLLLFGAEEGLLELARRYVFPIKFAVPTFLFNQFLSAFVRNDGNPGLATGSAGRGLVISGILIFLLPAVAGTDSLWYAMPITELVVAVFVIAMMVSCTRQLLTKPSAGE